MKKMKIKFFCNLERVYITDDTKEERIEFINQFIDLLEKIECNHIEFSFLSNVDMNVLIKFVCEFNDLLRIRNSMSYSLPVF